MTFGVGLARVIMALLASMVMTSTVAAPMAYQAYSARSHTVVVNRPRDSSEQRTSVLPRSETADGPEGLYFSPDHLGRPTKPLDGAVIVKPIQIFVSQAEVQQVKFLLDEAVVSVDSAAPWEIYGGELLDPARLTSGQHMVRAEVTLLNGDIAVYEAKFTTL
ncbi:MAG TPA: hypothetical protein VL068_13050 [Microthrixaceae bacterium]|nr:hypothetical protein [Microthrixaceae bacterium]